MAETYIVGSEKLPMQITENVDIKSRYEDILNTAGEDNIKLFLNFAETDGIYRNLLDRQTFFADEFTGRHTSVKGGPLGNHINPAGNGRFSLVEQPFISKIIGTTDPAFSKKYATKIEVKGDKIGKIRVPLKKIGNVNNASVKFRIFSGTNQPENSQEFKFKLDFTGEAPFVIKCADIKTTYAEIPFPTFTSITTHYDYTYWLVMEYEDDTGINAENYVQWSYGADTNGKRAVLDGANWMVTDGETHNYKLYNDALRVEDDFTFIIMCKHSVPAGAASETLFVLEAFNKQLLKLDEINGMLRISGVYEDGHVFSGFHPADTTKGWNVIALTFSKDASKNKIKLYQNGILKELAQPGAHVSLRGKGCTRMLPGLVRIGNGAADWEHWRGSLGPILMINKELSKRDIARITDLMLHQKDKMGV